MKILLSSFSVLTIIASLFSGAILPVQAEAFGNGTNQVIAYGAFPSDIASSTYSVTVNGTPVYVHKLNNNSYAHFAFAGRVDITVKVNDAVDGKINAYKLSPLSYGIASTVSGNKIKFSLKESRKLVIHDIDSINENLILIADPLEENPPNINAAKVMNASTQNGVDKTGASDSSKGINTAVQKLPSDGVLYFPAGKYAINDQIILKSNMTLYLAPRAEIYKNEGNSSYSKKGNVLYAKNVKNLKIKGRGRINGNGRVIRSSADWGWMDLLDVNDSSKVTVEDITFFNSPGGQVFVNYCHDVNFYNIKQIADPGTVNTDGIDFLSSTDCSVDNSFVYNTDDMGNIATDTSHKQKDSNNIKYTNMVHAGFVGSGSTIALAGGVEFGGNNTNITYENIDTINCGSFMRLEPLYGGDLNKIYVNNIRVEKIRERDFTIQMYDSSGFDPGWNGKLGNIKNVFINNVTLPSGSRYDTSRIQGFDSTRRVSAVNFDSVYVGSNLIKDYTSGNITTNEFIDNIKFSSNKAQKVNVTAIDKGATKSSDKGSFTFTRSGSTAKVLTVNYKLRGNAINGKDYQLLSGSVIIPAGASSKKVNVLSKGKGSNGLKQVIVVLKTGAGYMMDKNYLATVNINRTDAKITTKPIKELVPVELKTNIGVEPDLPYAIPVKFQDNSVGIVTVKWDDINPADYSKLGNFIVYGTVDDTNLRSIASIKVNPIISVASVSLETTINVALKLPSFLTSTYSDNSTGFVSVKWNEIDAAQLAKAGSFTVEGSVTNTDIPAVANIVVVDRVTYSFSDFTGNDTPLEGIHGGIDFGTGKWLKGSYFDMTDCGYFATGDATSGTFILPEGKVLKSLKVSGQAGKFVISDGVNPDITGNVTGVPTTIITGWELGSSTITIKLEGGWNSGIDDVEYIPVAVK